MMSNLLSHTYSSMYSGLSGFALDVLNETIEAAFFSDYTGMRHHRNGNDYYYIHSYMVSKKEYEWVTSDAPYYIDIDTYIPQKLANKFCAKYGEDGLKKLNQYLKNGGSLANINENDIINGNESNSHSYHNINPITSKPYDYPICEGRNILSDAFFKALAYLGGNRSKLSRRLLDNYMNGYGKLFTLTFNDMKDIDAVYTDTAMFDQTRLSKTKITHVQGTFLAAANLNGTLGQFTVEYEGDISWDSRKSDYHFDGNIIYKDTYDFDAHPQNDPNKPSFRSPAGEWRTKFGREYIPGTKFHIRSPRIRLEGYKIDVRRGIKLRIYKKEE